MHIDNLEHMLLKLKDISILVLGDYFLDKYMIIDPLLNEKSIETGFTAYQTVAKKLSPGAAGTVTNNLTSLGVGEIIALGFVGDDGEGFELIKGLKATGVITENIIVTNERFTSTYIKPMIIGDGGTRELNRIDIKNRMTTTKRIEDLIIERLINLSNKVNAIVVMDQVTEKDCGVVTSRVREVLSKIGEENKNLLIYADSRAFTSQFKNIIIKCNHYELVKAFCPEFESEPDEDTVIKYGVMLSLRNNKTVFTTMGSKGQFVFEGEKVKKILPIPVEGPLDVCGAGDATTSGIISALCCGADFYDAALLGNIVASITIQQLGSTGKATVEQVLERNREIQNY